MSEEKQREKQKAYEKYVKKITPVHNLPLNMLKAFLTGGLICVLGQLIREFDSCIIKIVRAGRIKPVLFLSSFSLYYLVIFSDM